MGDSRSKLNSVSSRDPKDPSVDVRPDTSDAGVYKPSVTRVIKASKKPGKPRSSLTSAPSRVDEERSTEESNPFEESKVVVVPDSASHFDRAPDPQYQRGLSSVADRASTDRRVAASTHDSSSSSRRSRLASREEPSSERKRSPREIIRIPVTIDEKIEPRQDPTDEKSLPVCLQELGKALKQKTVALTVASIRLTASFNPSSEKFSQAILIRRVRERRDFIGVEPVSEVERINLAIRRCKSILMKDKRDRIAIYEREVAEFLWAPLQKAAADAWEQLTPGKDETDESSHEKIEVRNRTFEALCLGSLKFNFENRRHEFKLNLEFNKDSPNVLKLIQPRANEMIERARREVASATETIRHANVILARKKELLKKKKKQELKSAEDERDSARAIVVSAARQKIAAEIVLKCLNKATQLFVAAGNLQKSEIIERTEVKQVLSKTHSALVKKIKSYELKDAVIEKGSEQTKHEAQADQAIVDADELTKKFNEEQKKLESEYDVEYSQIIKEITYLEAKTSRFESLYAAREIERKQLDIFYRAERPVELKEEPGNFISSLELLKSNFGLSFDASAKAAALELRLGEARKKYKMQHRLAGKFLGDSVSPKLEPARQGALSDVSDQKGLEKQKIDLVKKFMKLLQKIVADNNIEMFWKPQTAWTWCCCWGGRQVRIGQGADRKNCKAPTCVRQIKEVLPTTLDVDNLDYKDREALFPQLKQIVQERLAHSRGRNESTTGVFLRKLDAIFNADTLNDELIESFRTEMFKLRDGKGNKLNLITESPRALPSSEQKGDQPQPLLSAQNNFSPGVCDQRRLRPRGYAGGF